MNLRKSLSTIALFVLALSSTAAFAQEGATAGAGSWNALAAAFAIGIAAFGGAFGQARAATAALEGIARNPAAQGKIFIPMILALALIESLVIYALVIAFRLVG